jgi:hypothetical protein
METTMIFRRRRRQPEVVEARRSRNKAQQRYVHGALPGLQPAPTDDREAVIEYFYQAEHLLVREEYLNEVRQILTVLGAGDFSDDRRGQPLGEEVIAGVRLVRLRKGTDTLQTLQYILRGGLWPPDKDRPDRFLVKGLGPTAASVNHLTHITGDAGCCPFTEPEPVDRGAERRPKQTKDPLAGAGVRVVVVDTPLSEQTRNETPWLTGVTGRQIPGMPALAGDDRYAGHGTFVAGLVRTMAPAAEVVVRGLFERRGAALETDLVRQLGKVLEEDDPDIISLSAGTYTFENNGLLAMAAFDRARLRHHKGVVLVAAAGNDGDRKPFWPAAARFAVSVGALNDDLDDRASFSNHGGWVDVYTHGEGIINAYPRGPYTYAEGQPAGLPGTVDFVEPLARWSGTSFSTPIVAGLIAARMSHTGENGQQAAAALVKGAQAAAQPGVGAVLFPK